MKVALYSEPQGTRTIQLKLSKTNLEQLGHLYEEYKKGEALPVIHRMTEDQTRISVIVEPDEVHYKDRKPYLGPKR